MLQWTLECQHFFEIRISIILDKFLEVGLLDYMIVLFLFLKHLYTVCFIVAIPFCIPTDNVRVLQLLCILASTIVFVISIAGILTGGMWYLIIVLIYISLNISDVNCFFFLIFICLLVIYISSLEKCLFKFYFSLLIYRNSLH